MLAAIILEAVRQREKSSTYRVLRTDFVSFLGIVDGCRCFRFPNSMLGAGHVHRCYGTIYGELLLGAEYLLGADAGS